MASMARDYLKDPEAIYRLSFALIAEEAALSDLPESLRGVATRMIHASGMVEIIRDLAWSGDVAGAAGDALRAGAPILCDSRMVAQGIIAHRLPGNAVICRIDDARIHDLASAGRTTRSAAAVELWLDRLEGAIVAIGNAPTALFRLLEVIEGGGPRPAAILALPVGFVGAAESKQALIEAGLGIPYLTLRGRLGGSAMAAAAINAIGARSP